MWFFRKPKTVDTIFFDIGGVVVDAPMEHYRTLGAQLYGCREEPLGRAAALHLPPLEKGAITSEEFWDRLGSTLADEGVGRRIPAWKFKGFWESLLLEKLVIRRDMLHMCQKLRRKVKVAALSNTIEEHALVLQKLGVYEVFRPVVLSCRVGMRKPDLEIYEKACQLAKAEPGRSLFIDDLLENIQAAEQAGFLVHHFENQEVLERDLARRGLLP